MMMMWRVRSNPFAVVVAALILGTAGVAAQGLRPSAADQTSEPAKTAAPRGTGDARPASGLTPNQALAREQLALIDAALADLHRRAQAGELRFDDVIFSLWERRRMEALRRSGAGKDEIVASLEKHVESLRSMEASTLRLLDQGQIIRAHVYDIQYRRREAEIWLNEEKSRR